MGGLAMGQSCMRGSARGLDIWRKGPGNERKNGRGGRRAAGTRKSEKTWPGEKRTLNDVFTIDLNLINIVVAYPLGRSK
ncbi:hypothetical protein TNCT_716511 [Trichonephila clavata]|uniref:Uncharacterized protein n=1 Tax=Trichonephila clavata TaxID=2740835 RepID=A0A8X6LN89_TRICU|nr:hypothetical protein TNCT_716511 [Trichonephila clavata]